MYTRMTALCVALGFSRSKSIREESHRWTESVHVKLLSFALLQHLALLLVPPQDFACAIN